jgi:NAD(P)-dependent dehydrogenase (short-subunit alcohol dehydrogenase family)
VTTIASDAGMGWPLNLPMVMQLLATQGFEAGNAWLEEHAEAIGQIIGTGYSFSKQCNIVYAKAQSWELAKRQIRINTLSPGSTETPMMPAFISQHGKENIDGWSRPSAAMPSRKRWRSRWSFSTATWRAT